jgi:hypothetical protein
MSVARFIIPGLILIGGLAVTSASSLAKPEYTKKEKKACAFCHVTATSKELNEAGKYYKEHSNSLEGYQPKKSEKK